MPVLALRSRTKNHKQKKQAREVGVHDRDTGEGDLLKDVEWLCSTQRDLIGFPDEVRREVGFALYIAQLGEKAVNVVPLVGFAGASVLEIISNFDGDTYRAVYTVQFKEALYVLHVFQKKSLRGRETPRRDVELIRERLQTAKRHYEANYKRKGREQDNAS